MVSIRRRYSFVILFCSVLFCSGFWTGISCSVTPMASICFLKILHTISIYTATTVRPLMWHSKSYVAILSRTIIHYLIFFFFFLSFSRYTIMLFVLHSPYRKEHLELDTFQNITSLIYFLRFTILIFHLYARLTLTAN